jgi:hypothetical protein
MEPDVGAGVRPLACMLIACLLAVGFALYGNYKVAVVLLVLGILWLGAACNSRFCAIERRYNR